MLLAARRQRAKARSSACSRAATGPPASGSAPRGPPRWPRETWATGLRTWPSPYGTWRTGSRATAGVGCRRLTKERGRPNTTFRSDAACAAPPSRPTCRRLVPVLLWSNGPRDRVSRAPPGSASSATCSCGAGMISGASARSCRHAFTACSRPTSARSLLALLARQFGSLGLASAGATIAGSTTASRPCGPTRPAPWRMQPRRRPLPLPLRRPPRPRPLRRPRPLLPHPRRMTTPTSCTSEPGRREPGLAPQFEDSRAGLPLPVLCNFLVY